MQMYSYFLKQSIRSYIKCDGEKVRSRLWRFKSSTSYIVSIAMIDSRMLKMKPVSISNWSCHYKLLKIKVSQFYSPVKATGPGTRLLFSSNVIRSFRRSTSALIISF